MAVIISGDGLSIADIHAVAHGEKVEITKDEKVIGRVHGSYQRLAEKVARGEQIYGVTTLFGALADQYIRPDQISELQRLAVWQHKSTTGPRLPATDVRAAMLLRANSLLKGVSAIRLEIIERIAAFLNAGAHPHMYQRGSIGASGDLVPLSYIAGSILGLDPSFMVDMDGETLDSHTALSRLGLAPLPMEAKEGLALNNGTGASTGVAANCLARAANAMVLGLGVHSLFAQAMLATDQSFKSFIHEMKPHPGQIWTAAQMASLLEGSALIRSEDKGDRSGRPVKLIQDRYGLRCLPQYLGPVVDAIKVATGQVTQEANCANDNPLVDPDTGEIYHTGNFLAQYTGIAMDSVRYQLGLIAKHVDSQIGLLMTPEFSGLNPSLIGNMNSGMNVGLKSLQVGGNQMMPLLLFYGNSVVDRFPTHAEQYNQNINSQAMNASNLTRDALDVMEHFLALSFIIGVQAVELRSKMVADSFDARAVLSPATAPLYETVRTLALGAPSAEKPMIWEDLDVLIQPMVEGVLDDISGGGKIIAAMGPTRDAFARFAGLA